MSEPCPCGSGMQYSLCCESYLKGASLPATPEVLMRSRYCAYVKRNTRYLIESWHPSCHAERFTDSIEESYAATEWQGLNVISSEIMADSAQGYVTFFARFTENQRESFIHERSRFLREEQRWYYIDGTFPPIGRNDQCPCGSGKKYKKCCGQN
ncbi:YchJ family protein [Erwinia sp. JUb26]|uniref:YchJ family protein n=1 Tax=Erwinia sp. JUb26 TaxID=2485126 RepID=UPI000F476AA0|nr:YchJ family protein [Erwinia sp. JUb26]